MSSFKRTIFLAVLFLLVGFYSEAWRKCIKVIDGDTILLVGDESIRLIGVDSPESKDRDAPVEYFAEEAFQFTRKLVEGKKVRLEYDFDRIDSYGRTLAYVYLEDGTFLNAEIIKQGYGYAYKRFPFKYLKEFELNEKEAKANNRGIWARIPTNTSFPPGKTVVYITRSGKSYHREECSSLSKSKIPILLEEANSRGFKPCSICDPPLIENESVVIVYITKTGKRFHKNDCSYLKDSKIAIPLEKACEKGYLPCSKCRPQKCKI